MKKVFTLLCAAAMVLSVSAQKKVAYVTLSSFVTYANDTKILPALKAAYTVTELQSTTVNDYSGYDVIVFSEVAGSADAGVVAIKNAGKPVLTMKVHAYKPSPAWGWATAGYNQDATILNYKVSDKNDPLFTGVTWVGTGLDEVNILSAVGLDTKGNPKGLTFMDPALFTSAPAVSSVAILAGTDATKSAIIRIPKGAVMASDPALVAPMIQVGINSVSYANVTDDGVTIIKNAINELAASSPSSVNAPSAAEVVSTEYYTLTGVKIAVPVKGALNIVKQTLADGSVVSKTEFIK